MAQPRFIALSVPTNRPAVENPEGGRKLAFGPASGTVQYNRVVGAPGRTRTSTMLPPPDQPQALSQRSIFTVVRYHYAHCMNPPQG